MSQIWCVLHTYIMNTPWLKTLIRQSEATALYVKLICMYVRSYVHTYVRIYVAMYIRMYLFCGTVQLQLHIVCEVELPCVMLRGCVFHIHVQHCHTCLACLEILCWVQLVSFCQVNSIASFSFMYVCARETLAVVK